MGEAHGPEAGSDSAGGGRGAGFAPAAGASRWRRLLRHRLAEDAARAGLSPQVLDRLAKAVERSEHFHCGEIRVCVEGGLPWGHLWRRVSARERAVALFGALGVWDTEHNSGVLIYLLVADRAIEIVADRGIASRVTAADWQAVLSALTPALQVGRFDEGLAQAIHAVDRLLQAHFPLAESPGGLTAPNELPNQPVVL